VKSTNRAMDGVWWSAIAPGLGSLTCEIYVGTCCYL
jgi:hypothetical protein